MSDEQPKKPDFEHADDAPKPEPGMTLLEASGLKSPEMVDDFKAIMDAMYVMAGVEPPAELDIIHGGVRCDHEGCEVVRGFDGPVDFHELRADAAAAGWLSMDDGSDYCPEHRGLYEGGDQ